VRAGRRVEAGVPAPTGKGVAVGATPPGRPPELLRVYVADECGDDGYPRAWHESIKFMVRADAGHRCVRCGHPYRCGLDKPDWSPCDERCTHVAPDAGPVRIRSFDGSTPTFLVGADGESYEAAFLRASFEPTLVAVEAAWRVLTVHHLDGDKRNCRWWNLAALCQRCHLTDAGQGRHGPPLAPRAQPWFRPYVAGYYAHAYLGEDLTREQAEARMDELLALEIRQEALLP
jgi:hypothetical protein